MPQPAKNTPISPLTSRNQRDNPCVTLGTAILACHALRLPLFLQSRKACFKFNLTIKRGIVAYPEPPRSDVWVRLYSSISDSFASNTRCGLLYSSAFGSVEPVLFSTVAQSTAAVAAGRIACDLSAGRPESLTLDKTPLMQHNNVLHPGGTIQKVCMIRGVSILTAAINPKSMTRLAWSITHHLRHLPQDASFLRRFAPVSRSLSGIKA